MVWDHCRAFSHCSSHPQQAIQESFFKPILSRKLFPSISVKMIDCRPCVGIFSPELEMQNLWLHMTTSVLLKGCKTTSNH